MTEREGAAAIERAAEQAKRIAEQKATAKLAPDIQRAAAHARVATLEEIAAFDRRQKRRERGEAAGEALEKARIPERFRAARLNDLRALPDDALPGYRDAVARVSVALDQRGIYALAGEIGDGKTHMACGLVRAFCEVGRSAKYMLTADYIDEYRARWKSPTAGAATSFRASHSRYALLVLDEWQVRNDTANENLILLQLLNAIYDNGGTALLVSNHRTKDEFEQTIDARVADRICDGGGVIMCNWPSLRGRLKSAGASV